jgi:hypothetical protein
MIIIGVAFNVIAGAMYGIDKVAYGKVRVSVVIVPDCP